MLYSQSPIVVVEYGTFKTKPCIILYYTQHAIKLNVNHEYISHNIYPPLIARAPIRTPIGRRSGNVFSHIYYLCSDIHKSLTCTFP